ncbi:hypothetical protein OHA37_20670 [Streptomyces sp. NBC_00335]|uniref:hypothetical protein n=1 Tax=unclassified Streptomyces TaxID=2593676 RepID=UPI0022594870|nr:MULTISPECIES: hypothetical protein [unclassified Streptomyces]MCX5406275.1 hypothetical protein [Streptomyces sp. NBC_00086]
MGGMGESYGTYRESVAELLEAAAGEAIVLSYEEDRAFAALGLNRFGTVGSLRLDWRGAEVRERSEGFDGGELRRLLGVHAAAGELAVVFWSNHRMPAVALEAALVARHAEVVVDCTPECWIHLTDSGLLIEFQDGEGFTVGVIPA